LFITQQRKAAETPKSAGRLSVPRLTLCTRGQGQRSRSLWVAVQVTTCRGRGHYGGRTTGLQAAQLVWYEMWNDQKWSDATLL